MVEELRLETQTVTRGFRYGGAVRVVRLEQCQGVRVSCSQAGYFQLGQGDHVVIPEGENAQISVKGRELVEDSYSGRKYYEGYAKVEIEMFSEPYDEGT